MIRFYFHPSPNPMKAALLLEELELGYELVAIDTFKGEQHESAFRQINPNGKVPALVDDDITIFDSQAILLHLAEKSGRFLPRDAVARGQALSWLMFVGTGLSPFSGQAVHFLRHAPEEIPYARNRYLKEVERHYRVLDERLSTNRYLAGAEYSIADMAMWGWANIAGYILGDAGLSVFPNVARLVAEIGARPAATRALALKNTLVLKTDFDEETRRALFPQNA